MSRIVPILLLGLSFFYPRVSSIIFIAFALLIECYIKFLDSVKDPYTDPKFLKRKYTEGEKKIFSKYFVFYRFPTTSSYLSMMFVNYIITSIILIPWLFYKSEFIQMVVILLNIPLCYRFSVLLRPLHYANTKPNSKIGTERDLIKSVYDKYVWNKTTDGEMFNDLMFNTIREMRSNQRNM